MLKNVVIKIVCLMFLTSVYSGAWQGSGTSSDPYQIYTKADMDALADTVNNGSSTRNKHFKLMADIIDPLDKMIGSPIRSFGGHFDGNQKSITVAIPNLFWSTGIEAVIENLNVNSAPLISTGSINAGLVGSNYGIVKNCNNYADITVTHDQLGGIVYANYGEGMVGGLKSGVYNCVNFGNLESGWNGGSIGGIIYLNRIGTVMNCINVGNITSTGLTGSAAGIVALSGINNSSFKDTIFVLNNTNIGTIIGTSDAGGIGSRTTKPTTGVGVILVSGNANHGLVKGNTRIGGIIGNASPLFDSNGVVVINNFNSGVIIGNSHIGCILGYKSSVSPIIENNHYDKQMCGDED